RDFSREVAAMARELVAREVAPSLPAIERQDFTESVRLLKRAGELGLTGLELPEKYAGLGLDKVTATAMLEALAGGGSFNVTFAAHTGIGTLPLYFFGNAEQKAKFLPALARAEMIAAYCLTEADSGSDALGAKTTAHRSEDGRHWVLNGTKQWI